MKDQPKHRHWIIAALVLSGCSACLVVSSAFAEHSRLSCGQISARGPEAGQHRGMLREAVQQHIARLNDTEWPGGPYVVGVSLLDLSTQKGSYGLQTTAVLQAVVYDRASGAVVGGARGEATAASEGHQRSLAARTALRLAADRTFGRVAGLAPHH